MLRACPRFILIGRCSSFHRGENGFQERVAILCVPSARSLSRRFSSHPTRAVQPSLSSPPTFFCPTAVRGTAEQDDGESREQCDSRFFLIDLGDPEGVWREGPSFPGQCGVGQTMNTVNVTRTDDSGKKVEVRISPARHLLPHLRAVHAACCPVRPLSFNRP